LRDSFQLGTWDVGAMQAGLVPLFVWSSWFGGE
jgi:hypothetical protein